MAGDTLIIVDQTHGKRVLECTPRGHLSLAVIHDYNPECAVPLRCQWRFSERGAHKGFRNLAEDRFLGRNFWWNFVVEGPAQKGWEHFVLDRRRNGYSIQIPWWSGLLPICAREDGAGIETMKGQGEGTSWQFIKVDR